MRCLRLFAVIGAMATVVLLSAGAQTASATVLCKNTSTPCSEADSLATGTEILLSLVSGTHSKVETGSISLGNITCSKSSINAKVTNAGGPTSTVTAEITGLKFENCNNCTVTTIATGTLEIHHIESTDNGTVTSSGTQVTALCVINGFSVHCIYDTSATVWGTLSGGKPAKLKVAGEIPRLTTNAFCAEEGFWTAEYEVTSPSSLYVEPEGTVLCAEAAVPCPAEKDKGTGVEVESNLVSGGKSTLETTYKTIECSKSNLNGEVTNTGGTFGTPEAKVTTLSFGECNCTVSVLKSGTLKILHIVSTHNGTVTASGTEVTTSCSTIFGTVHCIYTTSSTDIGTLAGGTPAKLQINVTLPRLSTNALCEEESRWKAEYEITRPSALYVEPA